MYQGEASGGADFWICRVVCVALLVDLSECESPGSELLWHSFQLSAIIHVFDVRSFSDPSSV
jgi:hypothetical protein